MDASNFSYFLRNPSHLYKISHQELQNLVLQYPYCQNLRYLLVKKSQQDKHRDYQQDLQLAATYSVDRKYLYYQINNQNGSSSTDDFLFNDDYLELKNITEDNTPPTEIILEELAPSDNAINGQNSSKLDSFSFEVENKSEEIERAELENDNNDFAAPILLENLEKEKEITPEEPNLIDQILEDDKPEQIDGYQASDSKITIEPISTTDKPEEIEEFKKTIEEQNEVLEIEEISVEEFKIQQDAPDLGKEVKKEIVEKEQKKNIVKKKIKKRPENEDLLSLLAKYSKENKKVRKIRKLKKKVENTKDKIPSSANEVSNEAQDAAKIDQLISKLEAKEKIEKVIPDIPLEITNDQKAIKPNEKTTIEIDLETPSETATTPLVENTNFEKAVEAIIEETTEKKKKKKTNSITAKAKKKKKKKKKKKILRFSSLKEIVTPINKEENTKAATDNLKDTKAKLKKKKSKKKIRAKQKKKDKQKPKKKKDTKDTIKFAKKSIQKDNSAISETLAKLLAQQGHHDMAILMYQKLSLIFPEKNTLFAREIKKLKKI